MAGDCPVVGGGGYTGFEHNLYRIEIAESERWRRRASSGRSGTAASPAAAASTTTVNPARVIIDAGRAAIVNSGADRVLPRGAAVRRAGGHLERGLRHDGHAQHRPRSRARGAASFGALPSTTDSVFFRLWNGIEDDRRLHQRRQPGRAARRHPPRVRCARRRQLPAGRLLDFQGARRRDRQPAVLVDHAPPVGIVYHRVPLAEINWTGRWTPRSPAPSRTAVTRFRPSLASRPVARVGSATGSRAMASSPRSSRPSTACPPLAGKSACCRGPIPKTCAL